MRVHLCLSSPLQYLHFYCGLLIVVFECYITLCETKGSNPMFGIKLHILVAFVPLCSPTPFAPTCLLPPTHANSCSLYPLHLLMPTYTLHTLCTHSLPQPTPTFAHLYPLCLLVPPTCHMTKLNIILLYTFFFRILN